jgi:RsiW-degrading membrane proteinase PrsW (M82 family)
LVEELSALAPDPASALVPYASAGDRARHRRAVVGALALFVPAAALSVHAPLPLAALATFVFGAVVLPLAHIAHAARSHPYAPDVRRGLTLLLTAVVLVAIAAALEAAFGLDRRTAAGAVAVAMLEVTLQLAAIAWVVRRSPARFRYDGVVVGATVGMGFALGQSALFALAFADRPTELLATLGAQTFLGPLAHGAVAALAGAAIGRTRAYQPLVNETTLWALGLAVTLRLLWDLQPAGLWGWAWSVSVVCAALVLLRVTVRTGVTTAHRRSACRRGGISPMRAPAMPAASR